MRILHRHNRLQGILAAAALGTLCLLSACSGGDSNNDPDPETPDAATCISLGCDAQNKLCEMSDGEQPACGECVSGYVLVGDVCLAEGTTCDTLDCASSNRQCRQLSERAVCSNCLPGFHEKTGQCVRDEQATCQTEYIVERCGLQNRDCQEDGQGAICGDCTSGYEERDGTCISTCVECSEQGKLCNDDGSCGACVMGKVDDGMGGCRDVKTCSETDCDERGPCLEHMDKDATCVGMANPCSATPNSAFVQRTGECVTCGDFSQIEGCTMAHFPVAAGNETCVCVPEEGYYWDTSAGFNRPVQCDLDGDGWVNTNAVTMRYSGDPILFKASETCNLLEVDRVVLRNDFGQSKTFLVRDPDVAGDSLKYSDGRTRQTIILQETARNDNPELLQQAYNDDELEFYNGVKLHAAQLNSMSKFCADLESDYNSDGNADVLEQQYGGRATNDFEVMSKFSHFAELHTFITTESPDNPEYKQLVITERPRIDLPLRAVSVTSPNGGEDCTNNLDDDGDLLTDCDDPECSETSHCTYWSQCRRFRSPIFDDRTAPLKPNTDFAQFSPSFTQRTLAASVEWSGMTHSSQFKCLDYHQTLPADPQKNYPNTVNDEALGRDFDVYSQCSPSMADLNRPEITWSCEAKKGTEPVVDAAGQAQTVAVFWGELTYRNAGTDELYRGGCVNECALSKVEPWSKLPGQSMGGPLTACDGWKFGAATLERTDSCKTQASNSGKQFCSFNACEGTLHTSRGSSGVSLQVCKSQSLLGGDAVLYTPSEDYLLHGMVPPTRRSQDPLCEDQSSLDPSTNKCNTGFGLY